MKETELLVARHGETAWNRQGKWQGCSDIPLNEKGIEQAEKLAEKLAGKGISHIYSSDLSRARTTANVVRKALDLDDVTEDPRLRERKLGQFEGYSPDQVADYMGMPPENAQALQVDELLVDTLPSVERWDEFNERIWGAFSEIASNHRGETCLVVAHEAVLRAISLKMGDDENPRLRFKNTDFIRLSYDNGSWTLLE